MADPRNRHGTLSMLHILPKQRRAAAVRADAGIKSDIQRDEAKVRRKRNARRRKVAAEKRGYEGRGKCVKVFKTGKKGQPLKKTECARYPDGKRVLPSHVA